MASIFSKIIAGEIPCYKVAEDEKHIAFLDINPLQLGHTLVMPKKEEDYIFGMGDDDFLALNLFSKRIAEAMKKALPCKRISQAVIGMEVPHVHIHLIPINKESDLNFKDIKHLSDDEMKDVAKKIADAMN